MEKSKVFTQRIVLTPALGRNRELIQATTEQVRLRQSQGIRASLSTPITGEGRVSIGIQFDNLADLQAFREKNREDAATQAYFAKISALQSQQPRVELWDVMVSATAATAPKYVQGIVATAALGQGGALRDLLGKRALALQAKGIDCAFSQEMASDAQRFGTTLLFASLADFEAHRAQSMADPETLQLMAKLTPLLAAQVTVTLSEVLVPFPLVAQRKLAGAASATR
ncbi:MAG: hypothetical protein ABI782_00320 [Anaerolineaceae bacterium]